MKAARSVRDGFDVYAKEDGEDYWEIVAAYLAAGIRQPDLASRYARLKEGDPWPKLTIAMGGREIGLRVISFKNPNRLVFRVEIEGKRYILKWMNRGSIGLKRLFPQSMGLTYYTRLFKKVRGAVEAGCAATQDYLLVAERWASPFRMEVLVLLEYAEGHPIGASKNHARLIAPMEKAVAGLLEYGLTLDDLSPYNFLAAHNRAARRWIVRVIDLSCRPPTRLNAVKMTMKMNARYGMNLPIRGVTNRIIFAMLSLRYRIRALFGKNDF